MHDESDQVDGSDNYFIRETEYAKVIETEHGGKCGCDRGQGGRISGM